VYSTYHNKFNSCFPFSFHRNSLNSLSCFICPNTGSTVDILFWYCSVPSHVFSLALILSIKCSPGSLVIVLFSLLVHAFFQHTLRTIATDLIS
jgi:hypothetical protein